MYICCVDDTFTTVYKDGVDDFNKHLNRQNVDILFTKEIEENGKITFLDCLVTCVNNRLQTTIYRKPTHTNQLLDQSWYNPTSHKATTTTTRRDSFRAGFYQVLWSYTSLCTFETVLLPALKYALMLGENRCLYISGRKKAQITKPRNTTKTTKTQQQKIFNQGPFLNLKSVAP